jgi:Tol biopolymer transport system component
MPTGNKKVKGGGALVAGDSVLWALRGNNTREFWMYVPYGTGSPPGTYVPTPPGGIEEQVAESERAQAPRWSPDGKFIAYVRPADGGFDQVFAAYAMDSAAEIQMTDIEGNCSGPVWNASTFQVAFEYGLAGDSWSRIGVASLGGESLMTVSGSLADCRNPEWSADGQAIFFESDDSQGFSQVWIASADGDSQAQITASAMDHELPKVYNKDTLVFQGTDSTGFSQVYLWDGSNQQEVQLTSAERSHENPSVATKTGLIAYQTPDACDNSQIAVIPVSGGNETYVTNDEYEFESPSIAQDASLIYCLRRDAEGSVLCQVDPNGSGYVTITDGCAERESPDCLPIAAGITDSTTGATFLAAAYVREDGIHRTSYSSSGGGMSVGRRLLGLDALGPNPMRGFTTLQWSLLAPAKAEVRLFDITGRARTTYVSGLMPAGRYRTKLDVRNLARGIYILRLKAGTEKRTYKLVID